MKEFIDKLIEKIVNTPTKCLESYSINSPDIITGIKNGIEYGCASRQNEIIDIINELAEEYKLFGNSEQVKGGWIACSERLPEENGYYLITIKYYHLHNNVTMGCFFDDGEWYKIDNDDKVLAWMPLPPAWKGENNGKA